MGMKRKQNWTGMQCSLQLRTPHQIQRKAA